MPFAAVSTQSLAKRQQAQEENQTETGPEDEERNTEENNSNKNYFQILSFAVLPQMLPDLISFTLYRFETNIRSASVLGLIGAGGIGHLLNTSFRTFQYEEAASIILILIILVMGVDWCSARLRKLVI